MHHLPKFFSPRNRDKKQFMDSSSKSSSRKPKLDRVNAAKNIDYEPSSSSSDVSSSSLHISSMEFTDRSSFRIEGLNDDFIRICRSLELSGPDDFAISTADWEARKARTSSDLLPRPSIYSLESPKVQEVKEKNREFEDESFNCDMATVNSDLTAVVSEIDEPCVDLGGSCGGGGGGRIGINGVRPPPVLKPPPSIRLPVFDHTRSTWDILKDFAPQEDEEEVEEEGVKQDEEEEGNGIRESVLLVESNWGSFTTSNDDDSSSSTTEPANISPNMRMKPIITSWDTGRLLGRGSFGSVYEGISQDGTFFAIKEVSLLDEDSQGRQSIHQLEQEIALLSAFQHENIVQYYGTHTDGSKLYIFLELVSQGSLMSLYQRISLLDSHVSAYTRQILSGLKYLHERDVVHRDIKCANILVDVNGSVKLADFGLAKATKLNDVKSCKGTAFWMAPEVVNGKGQGYGLPADIWSLGCTVLEMLSHKLPYSEMENPMQALYRIGRGIPPAVPDSLSKDAQDFILMCLKVNPYDRPSAADLLCHSFVKRPHSSLSGSMSPYRPVRSN